MWDHRQKGIPGIQRAWVPSNQLLTADNLLRRPVHPLVDFGVAHDGLHILAGLGEGDGLDKFVDVAVVAGGAPVLDSPLARIVGSQSVLNLATEMVNHGAEIMGP